MHTPMFMKTLLAQHITCVGGETIRVALMKLKHTPLILIIAMFTDVAFIILAELVRLSEVRLGEARLSEMRLK